MRFQIVLYDCDFFFQADAMAEKIGFPAFILNDTALDDNYKTVNIIWLRAIVVQFDNLATRFRFRVWLLIII